jgi:hypothetical protein
MVSTQELLILMVPGRASRGTSQGLHSVNHHNSTLSWWLTVVLAAL